MAYIDYLKDLAKQSKTQPNLGENHKLYKTIMDEFKIQSETQVLKDENIQAKKKEYEYLINGLDQLSIKQVDRLVEEMKKDKNLFLEEISKIQQTVDSRHYPYGLLLDTEYWEETTDGILTKYKKYINLIFKREDQIHALYETYKDSKNPSLRDDIEQLLLETNLILSKEDDYSADIYYRNIPSLANAEAAYGSLTDILRTFLNNYKANEMKVRDIPVFKTYQFHTEMNDTQKHNHLLENSSSVKSFLGEIERVVDSEVKTIEKEINNNQENKISEQAMGDWEDFDYSHEFTDLSEEEFKKLDEQKAANRARKASDSERKNQKPKKTMAIKESAKIKKPSVIKTEIIQHRQPVIYPVQKTEIFTFESPLTFSGRNNSKSLPSLEGYSSTAVLGTIGGSNISNLSGLSGENSLPYTQLIDGSNTIPLAEVEGGHSDIVLESQNPKTPVISGSTQTNQLSDETVKTSEELKVTEVPVAQESQVLSEVIQVSDEVENQNSLDDYTKSQINFWIGDFSSTLNKLTSNQLHSEDLADLISRGQELRKKLDNALGEGKYNGDLKRDLDQLETISNAISRMTGI